MAIGPDFDTLVANVKQKIQNMQNAERLTLANALIKMDSAFFPGKELAAKIPLESYTAPKATIKFFKPDKSVAQEFEREVQTASAPSTSFSIPWLKKGYGKELKVPAWETLQTKTKVMVWGGIASVVGISSYFALRKKKK